MSILSTIVHCVVLQFHYCVVDDLVIVLFHAVGYSCLVSINAVVQLESLWYGINIYVTSISIGSKDGPGTSSIELKFN